MNKLSKFTLAFSLASVIRAVRRGPRDAARRTAEAFDRIDPLSEQFEPPAEALTQLTAIPQRSLGDLFAAPETIKLNGQWNFIDGALPYGDLLALLTLLLNWKPALILEIGTYNGATTAAMALNAPQAIVHTLDLPLDFDPARDTPGAAEKDDLHLIKQRKVGQAYSSFSGNGNIVQHYADSATWDYAPVQGASFFFIDGAHTYEYAKNDTEKCLAAAAAVPARFVIHDCDERHPGVVRYLQELVREGVPLVRLKGTSIAYFDSAPSAA